MSPAVVEFTTILLAFFAIMNPVANTPIFLALTDGLESASRRNIAIRALLLAFGIIAGFALCGNLLFEAFGITLSALRIAGGILVAMVGFHLLQGEASNVHTPKSAADGTTSDSALGIAITPLALPILAGPGTIATAMSFSVGKPFTESLLVVAAFAVVCLLTLVFFLSGEKLVRFLGRSAIKVVTRLMGLILAVIGIQMLVEGIGGAVTDYQKEAAEAPATPS
ncbi:MAG: MarC family protein [Verrucomicrobiota bacterium]